MVLRRRMDLGVAAMLAVAALIACGRTGPTRSSGTPDGPGGNGTGGAVGSGSTSSTSVAAGGARSGEGGFAGAGGENGAGATGATAAGGNAGAAGTGIGAGGTGTGTAENPFPIVGSGYPVICDVPSLPAPTTSEGEARAQLIGGYCAKLEEYPCLSYWSGEASDYARTCELEARVAACELDVTLEYQRSIPPGCDDEWRASLNCATAVDYAATCDNPGASIGYSLIPIVHLQYPGYDGEPCRPERQALSDCIEQENPWSTATGDRGECRYHVAANNPGICEIICDVESNYFEADCFGSPEGGPFECGCRLNGKPLLDDGFGYNPRFFGASCEDSAQRMADGECIERIDCCFTWQIGLDSGCACTADPQNVGHETCESAATAGGGEVVDLCPQYEQFSGGLNIERSSN